MARLNRKSLVAASHAVDGIVAMTSLLALHGWNMSTKRGAGA